MAANTIKASNERENEAKRGIRKDEKLYNLIMLWQQRSADYIKERGLPKRWDRGQKIYENDVWEGLGRGRAKHLTKCRIPVAFDAIETGLPIATSRVPKPDVKPLIDTNSSLYQQYRSSVANENVDEKTLNDNQSVFDNYRNQCTIFAQKMQRQLIKDWNESGMPEYNRQMYRNNGICGNSIIKSVWDSDKNEIVNTVCDIRTIFPTPGINKIKEHINSPFIYAPVMPISEVMRIYGVNQIEPDSIGEYDSNTGQIKFSYGMKTGWAATISASLRTAYTGIFRKRDKDELQGEKLKEGYCQVIECYMPDDSEEEYQDYVYDEDGAKTKDDNGDEKLDTKIRKVFHSGHKIVTIIKNNPDWILEEIDNPYKDGLPPFFELKNNAQANDFYGISDIYMMEDLIDRINVSASNINDNLRMHGNPIRWELINSKVSDQDESTNEIGQVVKVKMPNAMGYLNPPQIGFDIKWWLMEFLFKLVDRVTKLSDAVRGFNAYSNDSGRKIRELRMAALGSYQPKLEAHVQLAKELYQHWAYIHQKFDKRIILQKNEDEMGESNYEEFIPIEMPELTFEIDVSGASIMPNDPNLEFEEGLLLYDKGIKRIGTPLISAEQLIDLAPSLEDKTRAKKYVSREEDKDNLMKELEAQKQVRAEAQKHFAGVVNNMLNMIKQNGIESIQNPEFDLLLTKAISDTAQFPELLKSQEFSILPPIIKTQIITGIAEGLGQDEQEAAMIAE